MPAQHRRVIVWNEFFHEQSRADVRQHYPDGIHQTIAAALRNLLGDGVDVQTATLPEPEHGLTAERLAQTDVLVWWGHAKHDDVSSEVVDRIQQRVLAGMGLVVLHSGHLSRIFRRLMGTGCMLRWRDVGEREKMWIVSPAHPIVRDLGVECIELPQSEMYGEPFEIPDPHELLMISSFAGGEVFRSACTFHRGLGKVFYFSPGHETYPIYHDGLIQRVIANGVRWAMPGA